MTDTLTASEREEVTVELEQLWERYWQLRQRPCMPTARHRREESLRGLVLEIERHRRLLVQ